MEFLLGGNGQAALTSATATKVAEHAELHHNLPCLAGPCLVRHGASLQSLFQAGADVSIARSTLPRGSA